jgi:hypothetical protein
LANSLDPPDNLSKPGCRLGLSTWVSPKLGWDGVAKLIIGSSVWKWPGQTGNFLTVQSFAKNLAPGWVGEEVTSATNQHPGGSVKGDGCSSGNGYQPALFQGILDGFGRRRKIVKSRFPRLFNSRGSPIGKEIQMVLQGRNPRIVGRASVVGKICILPKLSNNAGG